MTDLQSLRSLSELIKIQEVTNLGCLPLAQATATAANMAEWMIYLQQFSAHTLT